MLLNYATGLAKKHGIVVVREFVSKLSKVTYIHRDGVGAVYISPEISRNKAAFIIMAVLPILS